MAPFQTYVARSLSTWYATWRLTWLRECRKQTTKLLDLGSITMTDYSKIYYACVYLWKDNLHLHFPTLYYSLLLVLTSISYPDDLFRSLTQTLKIALFCYISFMKLTEFCSSSYIVIPCSITKSILHRKHIIF